MLAPSELLCSKNFQKTLILAFEANSTLSRKNETKIVKITHSAKPFGDLKKVISNLLFLCSPYTAKILLLLHSSFLQGEFSSPGAESDYFWRRQNGIVHFPLIRSPSHHIWSHPEKKFIKKKMIRVFTENNTSTTYVRPTYLLIENIDYVINEVTSPHYQICQYQKKKCWDLINMNIISIFVLNKNMNIMTRKNTTYFFSCNNMDSVMANAYIYLKSNIWDLWTGFWRCCEFQFVSYCIIMKTNHSLISRGIKKIYIIKYVCITCNFHRCIIQKLKTFVFW